MHITSTFDNTMGSLHLVGETIPHIHSLVTDRRRRPTPPRPAPPLRLASITSVYGAMVQLINWVLREREDCIVMATLHTDFMEIVNSYCGVG